MRLCCLTATYKRPECLANVLACFLAQDYDPTLSRLFILDDAAQHDSVSNDRYELMSTTERYESLPLKMNALIQMAESWRPDGYVVFEDDDVFLPWHLSQIADAFKHGCRFFQLPHVYTNYLLLKGDAQIEETGGRFHSSWAFRRDLMVRLGGWIDLRDDDGNPSLMFDQHLGGMAKRLTSEFNFSGYDPSYVYRWGSAAWNGSQVGDRDFKKFWDELGRRPAPHVGKLIPKMDAETTALMQITPGAPRWPL